MNAKKIIIPLLFVCFSVAAKAWGPTGHRIVGQIAESYLTPEAKKAIYEILGTESPAIASTWADFIRSDSTFNYLTTWHYLNVKAGMEYAEFKDSLQQDTATDAWTKLNFLITELKNKELPNDTKLMYLRLLIHLAGDVHQPMHISREEDLGGNKIKVMWLNEPSNLHSMWDEKLIDYQKLSYTEYAAAINHTTQEQRAAWQNQPMTEWFFESYQIAGQLYSEITEPQQKLGYRYNFDHIATVNRQLVKAGVRLAGLLNEIFG